MTREEAIRILASSCIPGSKQTEALETLIPELKESEDERIRKQLIDAIKIGRSNSGISFTEEAASRYIAWLEKQKEASKAIEAVADLERTYFCNPDKLPKWLKDDIARRELDAHTKGYNKGYKDAEKRYNESVAYHYPDPIPPGVAYKSPQCYTDVMITPNTNSGTSTLKAEG